ncbi:MAG TPA: FAD-binding oxidoreductase [Candidatus Avamphibacillus intestinigallinarum]|nr:FAD-binding oxidoreductase [Candidatus Avamphibacillus intestinigallinarum]
MTQHMIIVGSGILGASTAFYLTQMGHQVTIIDRKDKGQATEAAAGIICPWVSKRRNKKWYTLAKNGAKLYPELVQQLQFYGESDVGYEQVGSLHLHTDYEKLEDMKARTLKKRENAPEIGTLDLLSPLEVQNKVPFLNDDLYGLSVSGSARLNGADMRDALLAAAKKCGATIIHGDASITSKNGKITGIAVNQINYEADQIILACGAWLPEILEPLGYQVQIKEQKAQIIELQMKQFQTTHFPVIMQPNTQYMLPFPDGRILLGTTHEDETNFDTNVTAGALQEILTKAQEIAPQLMHSTFKKAYVGFRPVSPNFSPLFGPLLDQSNVFVANGLGSSGLTMGPYIGKILAAYLSGYEIELDLDDYPIAEMISKESS